MQALMLVEHQNQWAPCFPVCRRTWEEKDKKREHWGRAEWISEDVERSERGREMKSEVRSTENETKEIAAGGVGVRNAELGERRWREVWILSRLDISVSKGATSISHSQAFHCAYLVSTIWWTNLVESMSNTSLSPMTCAHVQNIEHFFFLKCRCASEQTISAYDSYPGSLRFKTPHSLSLKKK